MDDDHTGCDRIEVECPRNANEAVTHAVICTPRDEHPTGRRDGRV